MSFVSVTRFFGCTLLLLAALGFSITYAPRIQYQAVVISNVLGCFGLLALGVSFATERLPRGHWGHQPSEIGAAVVAACVAAVVLASAVS